MFRKDRGDKVGGGVCAFISKKMRCLDFDLYNLSADLDIVSSVNIPIDGQFADVISDVISRPTSGSGRSTSGFGYWHSIATFF